MQIFGPSCVHGAQPISGPHVSRASGASAPTNTNTSNTTDELQISAAAASLSDIPDIRAAKVASIRSAIADGTYETAGKLSAAVDRMLDQIG